MFAVGDEVVYKGSLGRHDARVAAVHASGAVDVVIEGIGLVRTDEGSLFGRYAPGGPIAPGTVIDTGRLVPPFATGGIVSPVGGAPADAAPAFLSPGGLVHDDIAAQPAPDIANPPALEA